ncbi:MAG: site-specific integrase [Clostridiales bacterium]|nr:site-specific integrase [Clostridiales bacterium]
MICLNKKCNKEIDQQDRFCRYCGKKQEQTIKRSRANGQGTVYKLPNGKWRAAKTIGYESFNDDGKLKKKRSVISRSDFDRKIDALNYLPILGTVNDERKTKYKAEKSPKADITLKQLYDKWEQSYTGNKKTREGYMYAFRVFEPVWNIKMTEQDIDDLQECMEDFTPKKETTGKRTRQLAKTALGLVYKYGIPRNFVPLDRNLSLFLQATGEAGNKKEGLSDIELELIRNNIEEIKYADYVYCHCLLGFRPTAFIDLSISDYNRKEKAFVGGIKTEAGIDRTVTVSPKIQPIIDRLVKDKVSGPVFCDENGKRMSYKRYRSIFYDVLNVSGIDNDVSEQGFHRLSPHSCRHTFATLMKRVSAPDKDKLDLIGHTDEKMLRHYQDVNYADLRKITDHI